MTPRRLLLLAALLLAVPAAAQGGRVEIAIEPELPIGGLDIPVAGFGAEATVRFLDTRPEAASLFIRTIGEPVFEQLVAANQGDGVWTVGIPFDLPREGIEVYAQYQLDGALYTEPLQSPQTDPFRVPVVSAAATSDVVLPARRYRMVAVPFRLGTIEGLSDALGSDDPLAVFGDDFGEAGDPSRWRLLRWDPFAEAYRDAIRDRATFERVRPGAGYWLITGRGGTFDVEIGLSTGVAFVDGVPRASDVTIPVRSGWNQIGNPYLFPIRWADVGKPLTVEDPVDDQFVGGQTVLQPWQGYFVYNAGGAGTLTFPAVPASSGGSVDDALADRLRQRAGEGAAVLSVTATTAGVSDQIALGLSGAAAKSADAPVDLHKPPPIDDGLRLAIESDGDEWISRFQDRRDPVWTLTLVAGDAVDLQFAPDAGWPDGLVVDDLDRGERLEVVGGRARVESIAGVETRRLAVRVDASAARVPGGPWIDAPHPNPARGTVSVAVGLDGPGRLDVFDVLGRVVWTAGLDGNEDLVRWDGRDGSGRPVASGVYLLRLSTEAGSAAARVTRLVP